MSGSVVGVVGLLVLLAGAAALEVAARRSEDRATAAQALGAAMRTAPGRVLVLAAWIWLGVHFLAR
ncbi:DUF6186 family protein [Modestobacter marinus]|uniref:DUF6186 family protein n=1 Tax=Modestobacter marinus TaxID=477641 RepID=UPI0027E19158|nr:DUF6186 family protein [Modestobacter marinus]